MEDATVIEEPIKAFPLATREGGLRARRCPHPRRLSWGAPFTDLDLEALSVVSAEEVADIGNHIDLQCQGQAQQAAPATQQSAFHVLALGGQMMQLPLTSTIDRYDWKTTRPRSR